MNIYIYTTVTSDISKIFSDGGMSYLFWMVLLELSLFVQLVILHLCEVYNVNMTLTV